MSELDDRMEAIRAALAAKYPARVVTRRFVDFPQHPDADLQAGIYTLLAGGEAEFKNLNRAYNAKDGKQSITLLGQIRVPAQANEEADGLAVEQAEFALRDEVIAFLQDLPEALCQIDAVGWTNSRQVEAPYGWIAFELEYRP